MKKLLQFICLLLLGLSVFQPVLAQDNSDPPSILDEFGVQNDAPAANTGGQPAEKKIDIRKSFLDTLSEGGIGPTTDEQTPANRLASVVGTAIRSLLAFLGTVVLVLVIYAGFLWATAAGNEEKIKKAKNILLGGVIGLIIILTSAYLVGFVVDQLSKSLLK